MGEDNFEELVGIAIGEASMCWSETPKGVFDSTRAAEIAAKLTNAHYDAFSDIDWEQRRYEIATKMFVRKFLVPQRAVELADALIAALKEEKK